MFIFAVSRGKAMRSVWRQTESFSRYQISLTNEHTEKALEELSLMIKRLWKEKG